MEQQEQHQSDMEEALELIRQERRMHDWPYIENKIWDYAESYTDANTDRLLEWYLEDADRVYSYMGAAVAKNIGDQNCGAYDILFEGQQLYWVEVFEDAIRQVKEEEKLLEDEEEE